MVQGKEHSQWCLFMFRWRKTSLFVVQLLYSNVYLITLFVFTVFCVSFSFHLRHVDVDSINISFWPSSSHLDDDVTWLRKLFKAFSFWSDVVRENLKVLTWFWALHDLQIHFVPWFDFEEGQQMSCSFTTAGIVVCLNLG